MEVIDVKPQPGPQTQFLSCTADIAFYGGAAGGGKSYGLLLDALRHWNNPDVGVVIFRRTSTQIRNEGGLWDDSVRLYGPMGAQPVQSVLEWTFPSGARLKFAHLEHEKTVFDWHGSQIPVIDFDELTHFTERQFVYMLSRNRSTSGVKPYIRGTCNPDQASWVRKWVDWYIGEDGYPLPERSGRLRWFIRLNDQITWADNPEELKRNHGSDVEPKSFTFIPSKLTDNQILMQKDPNYRSNLLALGRIDRLRLLGGNWNVRAQAGSMFRKEWFQVVDAVPSGWIQSIRFWDRAATKPNETNKDPDWTRGLKLYKYADGTWCVVDLKSMRDTPHEVEKLIKAVASMDSQEVRIMSQQDPGSAGVAEAMYFTRMLNGYDVRTVVFNKDKLTRAKPVSAQCEAGNVKVLRAPWNEEFFTELENFPEEGFHDDIVDVLSGAFNELCTGLSLVDAFGGT